MFWRFCCVNQLHVSCSTLWPSWLEEFFVWPQRLWWNKSAFWPSNHVLFWGRSHIDVGICTCARTGWETRFPFAWSLGFFFHRLSCARCHLKFNSWPLKIYRAPKGNSSFANVNIFQGLCWTSGVYILGANVWHATFWASKIDPEKKQYIVQHRECRFFLNFTRNNNNKHIHHTFSQKDVVWWLSKLTFFWGVPFLWRCKMLTQRCRLSLHQKWRIFEP